MTDKRKTQIEGRRRLWRARWDLNPRPLAPQAYATALLGTFQRHIRVIHELLFALDYGPTRLLSEPIEKASEFSPKMKCLITLVSSSAN